METRIPLEKCYVNYTYIYAASEGGSPIKSGGSIYTGQDGRFKIVLRPHSGQGEVKLSAQHEGYVAAFLDPIPVPAKGGEREVVLSLGKQGISLEVAVQDEAGRPVQGATISLTARGDVVETDDEGVARFELMNPKGGEFLLIRCGGPSPVYHRITPAEAAAARVVVQVSHPEGGS
jgi:hypothetical protein